MANDLRVLRSVWYRAICPIDTAEHFPCDFISYFYVKQQVFTWCTPWLSVGFSTMHSLAKCLAMREAHFGGVHGTWDGSDERRNGNKMMMIFV